MAEYFIWFVIYSVIGWIYESIVVSIQQKKWVNRGFLNGPYCPIYGCGALLAIGVLGKIDNVVLLFFLGAVLTCTLEYLTSYAMEKIFHARWWDYSNMPLNINGRICVPGAIVFGIMCVLIIKIVHPYITGLTSRLSPALQYAIALPLAIGMTVDLVFTLNALSDFVKKLEQAAAQQREIVVKKLKQSAEKLNLHSTLSRQQRRIILAFPKLKLHSHNEILSELRQALEKRRH